MSADIPGLNDADARRVAEAAAGRVLKPSEVSSYWYGRGFAFLREEPGKALLLYARKLLLLAHSYEVPTNSDIDLFRERSRVLGILRIPFSLLLLAGLAGLALSARGWRRQALYYPLLAAVLLTPLIFFAAFRLRLPAAALLAPPAGYALDRLVTLGRERPWRALAAALPVLAAAFLLSLPWPLIREISGNSRAAFHEFLGVRLFEEGRVAEAEGALREAALLRPLLPNPHWYLARVLEARGDREGALAEWKQAAVAFGPQSEWGRKAGERYYELKRGRGGDP
jgi:uncharacterized membrane protein